MSRASRKGEYGGARIKTLIVVIILGAAIFCAVKIVPPYFDNYQLQDSMREMAAYASATRKQDDDIRAEVEKKVKQLGIPADSKDIQVSDVSGNVQISVDYTVPIDLAIYQLQLHFHPQANNASL
jgi:cell division protein FtsL